MAESESESLTRAKKICKYCNKNTASGQFCKTCGATYHNSCATRVKMCCEQLLQRTPIVENVNSHLTEELYLREENLLLRQIIQDKDTIIIDKDLVISLLNEKISNLEKSTSITKDKKTQNMNKNPQSSQVKNMNDKTDNTNKNKNEPVTTKQTINDKVSPRKQSNLKILQSKQTNVINHLININNDTSPEPAKGNVSLDEEEPFQSITSRRKRNREPKVHGEAEITKEDEVNGFMGKEPAEKKIWLFVGRVKDHVTEKIIQNFLKRKTNAETTTNIHVEEIDTYKQTKDNKCFKVGLNYNLLETAYTSTFWPRGVTVERFNFRKEERYLNRLRNKKSETANFLREPQDQTFT